MYQFDYFAGNFRKQWYRKHKLQEVIEEAWSFPESGSPVVNEFVPTTEVRKKLVANYIMYYLPDSSEKMIFVLRIVYGRRNVDEILRQLNV